MITKEEFLSNMKSKGTVMAPAAGNGSIMLANTALQEMHVAMLPDFMIELYEETAGINLDNGYIFGPSEIFRAHHVAVPSIIQMNQDIISKIHAKTVFGRNDLFWFAFDSFGLCFMLNNLNLKPLRKYEDPYRALTDCLLGGKI